MTRILVCALAMALAGAHALIGQQPQQNPPAPSAPGASPGAQPSPTAPPSAESSQDKAANNSQIESNIRDAISSDPALSGTSVQVSVDDANITLTGSVQSQAQIERVMALAAPYYRYRNVVNKINMK
jgi:flagellar biosynthesis/type III secretory pathway M-ring protein FliF/YscJ